MVVRDEGPGIVPHPGSPGLGLGLPLIASLAESVQLGRDEHERTEVCMTFSLSGAPHTRWQSTRAREASTRARRGRRGRPDRPGDADVSAHATRRTAPQPSTPCRLHPPSRPDRCALRVANGPLAGPVLNRVVSMVLARAACPLDRLDDALILCDAISAHAPAHARDGHLSFTLTAEERESSCAWPSCAPAARRG